MSIRGHVITDKNGDTRKGESVDRLLSKIEDLGNATIQEDGLMSKEDKRKFSTQIPDEPMSILDIDEICNF